MSEEEETQQTKRKSNAHFFPCHDMWQLDRPQTFHDAPTPQHPQPRAITVQHQSPHTHAAAAAVIVRSLCLLPQASIMAPAEFKIANGQMAKPAEDPPGMDNPDVPRSNRVPSADRPDGHWATPRNRTPLAQHLDYFDINKDGAIMPWETFWALRYLKFAWEPFNSIICFWLTLWFHAAFAWPSQGGWLPHPLFPIITSNAAAIVHGSSSGCINQEGHFIPAAFEKIFATYDRTGRGRLSLMDVLALVWSKASISNVFGTFATTFQWLLTWWLFRDDSGLLRKADVRGIFDGTAFYRLADRTGNPWYGMAKRRDAVELHNMG